VDNKKVYHEIKAHIQSGAFKVSGKELFIDCPGCGDESHFSVNIYNGRHHCFKCSIGGHLATEIINNRLEWKKLTHNLKSGDYTEHEARRQIILPVNSYNIYESLHPELFVKPKRKHVSNSLSLCQKAFSYCLGRGVSAEQIRDYKVYICPNDPRVYFPYWNESAEITYHMGRKIMGNDDYLKTKDAENSEKPLFGRHITVHKGSVILVEGVFDHFVTSHSYALMGSSINSGQIIQLRNDDVKRVFVLGDPDASEKAELMAKKIRQFRFDAFPVYLHTKADPAKLGRRIMSGLVEQLLARSDKVFEPIHIVVV